MQAHDGEQAASKAPASRPQSYGELSDEDLESVVGGIDLDAAFESFLDLLDRLDGMFDSSS